MRFIVILFVAAGAILTYLLSAASANTAEFSGHYRMLLIFGGVLVLCLLLLVVYQLFTLRAKLRARVFGAKLTVRLMWMFALMALLPSILVYSASVMFLKSSIDTWFNVRVDTALEGGLDLGRTALDSLRLDLVRKGEAIAIELAEQPASTHFTLLHKLRARAGIHEAALLDTHGQALAFSSNDPHQLLPSTPSDEALRQVRDQQTYSAIETVPGKGMVLRALVPVNTFSLQDGMRILQVIQPVPKQLELDAETVQSGYRDYQELQLSRLGIKRIYGFALTFTLLLSMFSAVALSFLLSERLSAPLGLLAEGTRAVAKGDFSRMQPVQSKDELGALMRSFNSMTRQLADARQAAEFHQAQLETAKTYLESILSHLSSGVITFDERFYLRTLNPAAVAILAIDMGALKGLKLFEWGEHHPGLEPFAHQVLEQFSRPETREWQLQFEYAADSNSPQVLLMQGTRLPASSGNGYVVVFDDISDLLQAQRNAAWGEVARRLAHEIKNPLTPIQLSAERLQHKLSAKLGDDDARVLARSTQVIVNQVTAMKGMVDAFSEYARLPRPNMQPLQLNALVREVVTLYEPLNITIQLALADQLPALQGDSALLRQVIHNLLKNAQDALANLPDPVITVRTTVDHAQVRLAIEDNGSGFPEQLLTRVFEPYVTTKPKGTGLGLAVVKKIVEEHLGTMYIENIQPRGARVVIQLPVPEEV